MSPSGRGQKDMGRDLAVSYAQPFLFRELSLKAPRKRLPPCRSATTFAENAQNTCIVFVL